MALREIVTYLCDPCLVSGTETEATGTHTISVDSYTTKVDLCPKHDAAVIDALRVLMGQRGDRSLICEHCQFISSTRTGLAAHQRARHGRLSVVA